MVDGSSGIYNTNSQIKYKTTILKSSLCDYSDACITVVGAGATTAARQIDRSNKQAIFKNCAPFTHCITEVNNTQMENTKYIDVVMNIIEDSENYSKTSGSLWQYYKDEPKNPITDSVSFKFKSRFLDNAKMMVS